MEFSVKRSSFPRWVLPSLLLVAAASATAQDPRAPGANPHAAPAQGSKQPAARAPILLELFTSEGCSSCPPADSLLRQLNGTLAAGQWVIALSEHVTYWNRLGWTDPFSNDLFTDRQSGYRDRFGLDSVYTPQLVINGREQMVGADREKIARAINSEARARQRLEMRIVSAQRSAGRILLTYSLATPVPQGGIDLFAVVADDLDQSSVSFGENGGRTLTHVSVARNLVRVARLKEAASPGIFSFNLKPPPLGKGGQHLVLFAQSPHFGPVWGVDALPLAP